MKTLETFLPGILLLLAVLVVGSGACQPEEPSIVELTVPPPDIPPFPPFPDPPDPNERYLLVFVPCYYLGAEGHWECQFPPWVDPDTLGP